MDGNLAMANQKETVKIEFDYLSWVFVKKDGRKMSLPKSADIEIIGNIYENPELLKNKIT